MNICQFLDFRRRISHVYSKFRFRCRYQAEIFGSYLIKDLLNQHSFCMGSRESQLCLCAEHVTFLRDFCQQEAFELFLFFKLKGVSDGVNIKSSFNRLISFWYFLTICSVFWNDRLVI